MFNHNHYSQFSNEIVLILKNLKIQYIVYNGIKVQIITSDGTMAASVRHSILHIEDLLNNHPNLCKQLHDNNITDVSHMYSFIEKMLQQQPQYKKLFLTLFEYLMMYLHEMIEIFNNLASIIGVKIDYKSNYSVLDYSKIIELLQKLQQSLVRVCCTESLLRI